MDQSTASNPYVSPQDPSPVAQPKKPNEKKKPDAVAYLACGWPLLLVLVGGAVGGGLGGLATYLNLQVYQSKLPLPAKVALIPVIGISAGILWLVIAIMIQMAIQMP